ncbi:MAG: hypothetical protein SFY67_05495 [Candidatus Melainabacteria bacterium]|nr:hypothetical protein [Candidatus Melainabacteria bacterium]
MSSGDNMDFAYILSNMIAWVIAKFKNKIPVEIEAGPAQLLSGKKGGVNEWRYLFPISLSNCGTKPIAKYSVRVQVPAYLLESGNNGIYELKVDKPGKELMPGKSVLITQLELIFSKAKLEEHKEALKRDYILCTFEIEGFSSRERRLYLSNRDMF